MVVVRRVDGHVVTFVEDRGAGFDMDAGGDPDDRIGLLGMQERAAAVGGRVRVEGHRGGARG